MKLLLTLFFFLSPFSQAAQDIACKNEIAIDAIESVREFVEESVKNKDDQFKDLENLNVSFGEFRKMESKKLPKDVALGVWVPIEISKAENKLSSLEQALFYSKDCKRNRMAENRIAEKIKQKQK